MSSSIHSITQTMARSANEASIGEAEGDLQGRAVSVKTPDSWYSRLSRKVTENLHYVGYALAAAGVAALALGAVSLISKNPSSLPNKESPLLPLGDRSIILLEDDTSFRSFSPFPQESRSSTSSRPSFDLDEARSVSSILGDEEMEEADFEQDCFYLEEEEFVFEETVNDSAIARALQDSRDESSFRLTTSLYNSFEETANDAAIARAFQEAINQ